MKLDRKKIHATCKRIGNDRGFEMTWCLALDSNEHVVVAFHPVDQMRHGRDATEVDAERFSKILRDS